MGQAISAIGGALGSVFGQSRGSTKGEDKAEWISDVNTQQQQALDSIYKGLNPQNIELGQQLAQSALGRGPSIAEALLKANNERTLAQQLSAARANRAVNPALAARQLSNAATQQNMHTAQQAAIARLQEQRQQQQAFSDYLNNNLRNQQAFLSGGLSAANVQNAAATARHDANDKNRAAIGKGLGDSFGAALSGWGGDFGGGSSESPLIDSETLLRDTSDQINNIMPTRRSDGTMVAFYKGGKVPDLNKGGKVPGKAKVKGDSPKNDTVNAKLSPGEVVVPRSVVKKGPEAAARFMAAVQGKQAPVSSVKAATFGDVVSAKKALESQLAQIEKMLPRKKA